MDLGGFMQNFVLKNPFQEMKAMKKPSDPKPRKSTSPLSSSSTCSASSPPIVSPTNYIKVVPNNGNENPGIGNTINTSGIGNSIESLQGTGRNCDRERMPRHHTGTLSSSSYVKAHVGSNRTFALHLKHKRVADNHTQLQIW